jgi:uncharacterized phage-associated protein
VPKTHQLLAYLVKHYPGLSITALMKLAYVVDLVSIGKGQGKISDFEYVRYKHGPFHPMIYSCVQELVQGGIIKEDVEFTPMGNEFIVYRYNEDAELECSKLTEENIIVIEEVLSSVMGLGAKALTQLSYKTKPMKKLGARQDNEIGFNEKLDLWTD